MEIRYLYDGSFAGFLSCVFTAYAEKEDPAAIVCDTAAQTSLFPGRKIDTDEAHARRVYAALRKISPRAAYLLSRGFLSCLEEKELCLLQLIRRILQEGRPFLARLSDPQLVPILQAVRHLEGECQLLRGFVRFSEMQGILVGEIQPKNQVLPLLRGHFCQRMQNERFLLYDRTHRQALLYAPRRSLIVPLEQFRMAAPDETEARFRRLWKNFYDTIAIRERENPRCRQTHMPKRYWGCMTEFQPDSYFIPSTPDKSAASAAPGVPGGKSVPGIPSGSAPSVPGSGP